MVSPFEIKIFLI